MISAINSDGVECLLNHLIKNASEGDWQYSEHSITDRSMRKMAEDIVMEQLYKFLNKELPYTVKVDTELWQEKKDDIVINHRILILKDAHKSIILGRNGKNIRTISMIARAAMEKLMNKKVHLYLFVKVKDNWIDSFK